MLKLLLGGAFSMAKKGQKQNQYTDSERELITMEYIDGKGSYHYLENKYNISWKTIETWVRKYRKNGSIGLLKKGKKKTSHLSELERLKLENEILKKFQAFLKDQQEKK